MADNPPAIEEKKSTLTITDVEPTDVSVVDGQGRLVYSEAERKLVRKLDIRLMPILFIAYFLSIVDRSNVSYAKIANAEKRNNLQATANISDEQFSVALAAFFVGYIVFEIPSNLIMKKVAAPIWIARIMVSWGIVTTFQVLITQSWHFILLRFLLGVCEAGFFPGVVLYLTYWYRKQEAAKRIAGFYVATTVAGVVGSAWAYGVQQMNGRHGYYGWQWLFLTSGVPTIGMGILVYFILPATPESVKSGGWLTPEEKELASQRLRVDGVAKHEEKFEKGEFIKVFIDPKNWLFIIMYFGTVMCANALGLFLPTILFMLGYTSLDATRMSIAPYAAGAVMTMGAAWVSDRTRQRAAPLFVTALIGCVGFTVLATTGLTDRDGKYAGCIIAVAGVFSAIPLVFSWLSNNLKTSTGAATAIALVSSIGNLGSVVASYTQYKDDKPQYHRSHTVNAVGMALTALVAVILRVWYQRLNARQRTTFQDTERAQEGKKQIVYML
ncbi:uncharacterized protein SPPG_01419 [Spizellomyces punctatus DAOM BR117]|uniref:Major facilitator superfamily (MFS) profile domain-containing protein n=1 Tax=Spizellomyces punctatus (strain DAOM BR117) TaxID=645134 RepID=A0A0L0HS67_SPIPD|nr:uncharacterized protein SPPG_01419 [Spizellomyces punctatus DAOM BR117]KND03968.1 hypothetical protein SPPG_01419 [Spizellomyces punctatus DAOM BR117]|eukprot:XP_016612007.1 hypothetical protein SPPG_01419 [Spizellomyces punctatus DAOM BR117]